MIVDNSFHVAQVVSDLVHHVKPLLATQLAAVAKASGLTLAQTGEAFRSLRDDGYRFQRDETLPLLGGLEAIAIQPRDGFELAVVVLLADALQRQRVSARLDKAWAETGQRLRVWPATLRAAMANGLVLADETGLIRLAERPTDADCLTRDAAAIAEPLLRIARSMRPDELMSVAEADCGNDVEKHLVSLRAVIAARDGILSPDEYCYPSKVVELRSSVPQMPGHAGCTAILLLNALRSGDHMAWFACRWSGQGAAYCALQPSRRDPILAGIRFLYETNRDFLAGAQLERAGRLGEGATIPVVDDL